MAEKFLKIRTKPKSVLYLGNVKQKKHSRNDYYLWGKSLLVKRE